MFNVYTALLLLGHLMHTTKKFLLSMPTTSSMNLISVLLLKTKKMFSFVSFLDYLIVHNNITIVRQVSVSFFVNTITTKKQQKKYSFKRIKSEMFFCDFCFEF